MNQKQRDFLAQGAREVANLAVGALLLGQFLAKEFSWIWTIVGVGALIVLYVIGYIILRRE